MPGVFLDHEIPIVIHSTLNFRHANFSTGLVVGTQASTEKVSMKDNLTPDAVTSEWKRMLRYFNITNDHWPFHEVKDWKPILHTWIEDNVDDICEQKPMHEMVTNW